MGDMGPPTCLANTRHRARFFYKLYTDRAFEAACGYLDARRGTKGPFMRQRGWVRLATGHHIMLRSLFTTSV